MFDAVKTIVYVTRFNKVLRLYLNGKISGGEAVLRIAKLEAKLPAWHFRLSGMHPPGYFNRNVY